MYAGEDDFEEELPEGFGELQRISGLPALPASPLAGAAASLHREANVEMQDILDKARAASFESREEKLKSQVQVLTAARAAMAAIGAVLAPRAILFFAMLGALGLTIAALFYPEPMRLLAAASFDVLVFLPIVYLYLKG